MPQSYPENALPAEFKVGEYVIESVLGYGGFGITYLARDTKLNSRVALKEYFPQSLALRAADANISPRGTGDTTEDNYRWGLQEFLKEARALAKFKHNHIVRVLRFLEANGTAYMVMEYEEGESLADYLRRTSGFLDEQKLLGVFLPILSGMQAVHDAGLLHLDIKPDNIYLRANGQPMLIDFGSARRRRNESAKAERTALTPGYSAIEHYPNIGKQGPWSDVYSIGATLYRCVTGKTPVDAMDRYQAIKQRLPDPLKPATAFERPYYTPYIRSCIDWAMQLSPKDRAHTAFALQEGLLGKPLTNKHPGKEHKIDYRSGFIGITKIATPKDKDKKQRSLLERMFLGSLFLVTVGVVTLFILINMGVLSEDQIADTVSRVKKETLARYQATEDKILKGLRIRRDPIVKPAGAENSRPSPKPGTPPRPIVPFDADKLLVHTLRGHRTRVESVAFLQSGKLLASASADGTVKVWNVETGELDHRLPRGGPALAALAASPDGRRLAVARADNSILLWDVNEKKKSGALKGHTKSINQLAFSPEGRWLASAGQDGRLILWDMESGEARYTFRGYVNEVMATAFSPSGRWVASGDARGEVKYWSTETGKTLAYFQAHEGKITTLAFSPDGEWVAVGGTGGFLKLFGTGLDLKDLELKGAPETVHMLAFSPDNKWLVSVGTDEAIQIWDVARGEIHRRLTGHNHDIYSIALSADGKLLASGGDDGTVRVWK